MTIQSRLGALVAAAALVTMAGVAQATVVTRYSFEDNLSDTAAGGTFADDLSVFGAGRSESYAPGIVGQAVMIDTGGTDAFRLRGVDSNDLDLAANFTLEAFVRPDGNNSGQWDRLWTKWGDGGNDWHWAFRYPNNGMDYFQNGAQVFDGATNPVANTIPLDQWSHVAIVSDGVTVTGYINGVDVISAAYVAPVAGAGAMNFGNFANSPDERQFTGLIDEALIHDMAVSESYLQGRANLLLGPAVPEPATAALALLALGGLGATTRRRRA